MPLSSTLRQRRRSLGRLVRLSYCTLRALRLWRKYRDATMLQRRRFVANLLIVDEAIRSTPPESVIVECGTWRGGMSAAMVEIGGPERQSWFFDSFEGLPPAEAVDGPRAHKWQSGPRSGNYDNCSASLDEFMATLGRTGVPASQFHVHKGFFDAVFPTITPPRIAVLRLDADWYASTRACLERFWPSVEPGGIAIIDDYGVFDGCTRAVHEYFARYGQGDFISETAFGGATFIRKDARR